MRELVSNTVYLFINTRGDDRHFLVVTDYKHKGKRYLCDYFDKNSNYICSSSFARNGTFCNDLTEYHNQGVEMKEFYIVWVEGNCKSPSIKYATIEEAKEACSYLIDRRGVKEVFILKKVGKANVPSRVVFEIEE